MTFKEKHIKQWPNQHILMHDPLMNKTETTTERCSPVRPKLRHTYEWGRCNQAQHYTTIILLNFYIHDITSNPNSKISLWREDYLLRCRELGTGRAEGRLYHRKTRPRPTDPKENQQRIENRLQGPILFPLIVLRYLLIRISSQTS